ncbi:MAG: dimethylsulfonioproprionate lyase family protein [Tabrizicola sp.]
MALWRDGLISAEVLEIYRVASAHDTHDPLLTLREREMPLPPLPPKESPLRNLYLTARDYLLTLDHAGAEEVRTGLPPDPGPEHPVPTQTNAVVDRWLSPALQALADRPAVSQAIAAAADQLQWITYDLYPRAEIGEAFATGHAYASIMGREAPFAADDFDLGIFLIAPGVLYRDHRHAAPELYAPLTGPHGWRFGVGRPLMVKPAHKPVWNPPFQPHLTKVGRLPFLGFFVWTGDVNETAQVLPSDDWDKVEGVEIT